MLGRDPQLSDAEREAFGYEPNPFTWKKLRLHMTKPDGGDLRIELLRHEAWLAEAVSPDGQAVWMDLPELSITGWTRVLSVEAYPTIQPSAGRVVTATFMHSSGDVVDLKVSAQAEPIGTTANHPFYSVDRRDYVQAGALRIGERLLLVSGDLTTVESITPRGPPQPVFNLEVHGEHVYHVGAAGVLVHNAYGQTGRRTGRVGSPTKALRDWADDQRGFTNPVTNRWESYGGTLAADHIYPQIRLRAKSGFDRLTPEQQAYLLNHVDNLQPLPTSWNSSKKGLLADEWLNTPMGSTVSQEYIDYLRHRQETLSNFADTMIEFWTS